MKIKVLNQETISKIAAGEVIIRPVSVVKELLENSIDAGSNFIQVEIKNGGKSEIRIMDDGCGIAYDEVPLAFKRHATSKINYLTDLDDLSTMGFRGEALASIISVADVTITTKADEEEVGSQTVFSNGEIINRRICPFEKGTDIIVSDLFKSIPARFKFLKKDETETKLIRDIVEKLALAHPNISFTLICDDKKYFQTLGNGSLLDTASSIFGNAFASHLYEFEVDNLPMKIYGLIGDLEARRTYRDNQIFFINQRYVKSKLLMKAYEEEWEGKLMKHQYPSGIIFVDLPAKFLDVNIHPQKTEIRIFNESLIKILFKQCIREALDTLNLIPEILEEDNKSDSISEDDTSKFIESYENTNFLKEIKEEVIQSNFLNSDIVNSTNSEIKTPFTSKLNTLNYEFDSILELTPKEKNEETTPVIKNNEDTLVKDNFNTVSVREEINVVRGKLKLEDYNLIGVIFHTFIILENEKEILIIDQHAAHEAVLYELFSKSFNEKKGFESQMLMIPDYLDLSSDELDNYLKVKDQLDVFGFQTELENNQVKITGVPKILNIPQNKELLIPLIKYFNQDDNFKPDYGLKKIITASCKTAIKGGNFLNKEEIVFLLKKLFELENPYTCPHGRPVIRKQTEYELEKLFKRVI